MPRHLAVLATLTLASCMPAPAFAAADAQTVVAQGITVTGLAMTGISIAALLNAEYRSTMRGAAFCAAAGFAVTVVGWLL